MQSQHEPQSGPEEQVPLPLGREATSPRVTGAGVLLASVTGGGTGRFVRSGAVDLLAAAVRLRWAKTQVLGRPLTTAEAAALYAQTRIAEGYSPDERREMEGMARAFAEIQPPIDPETGQERAVH